MKIQQFINFLDACFTYFQKFYFIMVAYFCLFIVPVNCELVSFRFNSSVFSSDNTQLRANLAFNSFVNLKQNLSSTTSSQQNQVSGKLGSQILVYPSPCVNFNCELGFNVLNAAITNLNLLIFDMKGLKIVDEIVDASIGYNKLTLSNYVSSFIQSGMFYVILLDSDGNILERTKFAVVTQ